MKNKSKKCCGRFKTCLSEISIGQYNTKLYYKGRESQSSSFGGLMTILCAIILITYSYFMILSILRRDKYNLNTTMLESTRFSF